MIVDEPPYELVVVFADIDSEHFVKSVIEKGQAVGCLRKFRWRPIRDPRRDTYCQRPENPVEPFLKYTDAKYVLTWDWHGSGKENKTPEAIEEEVKDKLIRRGIPEHNICTICFFQEVEAEFNPIWDGIKTLLENIREGRIGSPSDQDILRISKRHLPRKNKVDRDIDKLKSLHPKEYFLSLIQYFNLRHQPELYKQIAEGIPLGKIKTARNILKLEEFLKSHFALAPK